MIKNPKKNKIKSNFIFTAVLSGRATGQINTAKFLISIFESNNDINNLLILEQPHLSKYFVLNWVIFLLKNIKIFFLRKIDSIYFINNRTKKSLWLREMLPLFLAKISKAKVYYHIVGNDFIPFLNSLNIIERNIFLAPITNYRFNFVVLGISMKKDIIKSLANYGIVVNDDQFIELPAFLSRKSISDSEKFFQNNEVEGELCIGFMSNLMFEKGINDYLEAINKYMSINPHAKCWVAGPKIRGVNYELLDELVSKNIITYYPFIDDEQKWRILSKTQLFILPTFYKIEYLPLAMVDAMLCGCKVVTCDSGEISRYINEYNGKIVEKRNAKAIVQAIKDYTLTSHSHDRKKIRDSVVLLFSEEKYRARISKMLAKY